MEVEDEDLGLVLVGVIEGEGKPMQILKETIWHN